MTKLTHLEIESNYFSGPFPSAIAQLDKLTYCYLRRNDMTFDLEFMKVGQFKENMFAMWLDGNDVSGTIPTEIGLMTGLASFSLANSTLTGTIPEALSKLELLEVVELHGNKLKGDMPDGV